MIQYSCLRLVRRELSITLDKFRLSNKQAYEMLDQDKIVRIYALRNNNPVNFFTRGAVLTFSSESTLAVLWN